MRKEHGGRKSRVVRVAMAGGLLKGVMVVLPSKAIVSRIAGMGNLLRVQDTMDSLLQTTDNMDSKQVDMVAQGNSRQVDMADHPQTNLLTVDRKADMEHLRLHRGTRMRLVC
jgi:hypothetical protein